MEVNDINEMIQQVAIDNKLPLTEDIFIAIAKGYERGYSDCANFTSNLIQRKKREIK